MRIFPFHWYMPTLRGWLANAVRREAVYPFYASFKITSRCHFGCPFCNVRQNSVPDLTTDEVKRVIDNLARSPVLLVSFEGGEPFLRDDIEELLHYLRSRRLYLLLTTSDRHLFRRPLERYASVIDFFHVSIDEGHGNLELFDRLEELVRLPTHVSVQVVVTRDTVEALEHKVARCHAAGANVVVIPAAHMEGTENQFPDIDAFEHALSRLRERYPDTIHTPPGYFRAYRARRCSSASVVIAPDGYLYYPCHILGIKGPNLVTTDLSSWLRSREAGELRKRMRYCIRNCGWYQFYSIDSYVSPRNVYEALRPLLRQGFRSRRRP